MSAVVVWCGVVWWCGAVAGRSSIHRSLSSSSSSSQRKRIERTNESNESNERIERRINRTNRCLERTYVLPTPRPRAFRRAVAASRINLPAAAQLSIVIFVTFTSSSTRMRVADGASVPSSVGTEPSWAGSIELPFVSTSFLPSFLPYVLRCLRTYVRPPFLTYFPAYVPTYFLTHFQTYFIPHVLPL